MKKHIKSIITIIVILMILGFMTISNATDAKETSITDFLQNNTTIDFENFKDSDVITLVEELTSKYSTEELATILEQYSNELEEAGLDEDTLDTVTSFLRSTDTDALRRTLKDLELEDIKTRLNNGEEFSDIVEETVNNMPAEQLLGMAGKILLTNKVFKAVVLRTAITTFIITVYSIIIRWIIYKKAGKHGWAAIIPIYKDVVWLKIAGLSPWLLLLFLIPIFGWIALAIIFIVAKFKVPQAFGQSAVWGLGLWFIPIIFESIVAFSKEFEYKKDENNENEGDKEVVETSE